MTRLARVRDTDACHGEEVYVRYASPLFLLSSLPVGHQTVATGCDLNSPAYLPSSFVGEASSITAIANGDTAPRKRTARNDQRAIRMCAISLILIFICF